MTPRTHHSVVSSDADIVDAVAAGRAAIESTWVELGRLAERFDALAPVVRFIVDSAGHLVVTGLGKSGLVGAKLAATLTSTGTPAFFVHAADALHGDSGCLTRDDALLAISNSGETDEVVRFARMASGWGAPVIAMTGCSGRSSLARLSTYVVDVSVGREADPWDLVPTTSTSVTMMMGDALAIALMVARGYGPEHFGRWHPGGSLGQRVVTKPAHR